MTIAARKLALRDVDAGPANLGHVRRHDTVFGEVASIVDRIARETRAVRWPNVRWKNDPVGFAREVLGIELWSAQRAIAESVRDHRNTTCRSGHKAGKSLTLAAIALWFFATHEDARVFLTAVTSAQIEQVLWREIRKLHRRARIPLGGELNETSRAGLRADDGRQIWGATARTGEGLAGISGANILVIADEASGIDDTFFEVLGTSLAGSGGVVRKCYISNPSRTVGEFFRSHTTNGATFNCIAISSEDTPNARGEATIPGLAGPEWIAERRLEWGEDSAQFRVRVKGEFVHDLDGKIISLDLIALATAAWDDAPEEGVLQIGIDPAGDGVIGDETAMAVRLGTKILTVLAWRGQTEDAVVANAMGLLETYRRRTPSRPRIAIDAEGGIGTRVYEKLRAAIARSGLAVDILPVRSGKKFWGSQEFELIRDGLWGQAREWLKAGGAIPDDVKLSQELNAPIFTPDTKQRYCATPKKELRKLLGRSTDRANAVCLAIWQHASVSSPEEDDASEASAAATRPTSKWADDDYYGETDPGRVFDPYGGVG